MALIEQCAYLPAVYPGKWIIRVLDCVVEEIKLDNYLVMTRPISILGDRPFEMHCAATALFSHLPSESFCFVDKRHLELHDLHVSRHTRLQTLVCSFQT